MTQRTIGIAIGISVIALGCFSLFSYFESKMTRDPAQVRGIAETFVVLKNPLPRDWKLILGQEAMTPDIDSRQIILTNGDKLVLALAPQVAEETQPALLSKLFQKYAMNVPHAKHLKVGGRDMLYGLAQGKIKTSDEIYHRQSKLQGLVEVSPHKFVVIELWNDRDKDSLKGWQQACDTIAGFPQ